MVDITVLVIFKNYNDNHAIFHSLNNVCLKIYYIGISHDMLFASPLRLDNNNNCLVTLRLAECEMDTIMVLL